MQPLTLFLPVIYAVFLWWFSTGIIMAVYGRSQRFRQWCFGGATVLVIAAFGGVLVSRHLSAPRDVYQTFTCGVILWGWQIAGYYFGFITGPRTEARLPVDGWNRPVWERFRLALRASLHHELLALAFAVLLAALTWGYPNRWALWIYAALWLMHSSAKLNIFLGVRNFRIELLPRQFHHLGSLLGKRDSNSLFPVSILAASTLTLVLIYQGIIPGTLPAQTVGSLLVATMIALGVLEHWLLVLPLPAMLWGWGVRPLPEAVEQGAAARSSSDYLYSRRISQIKVKRDHD